MKRIQEIEPPDDAPVNLYKSTVNKRIGPSGPWDPTVVDYISVNSHLYLFAAEQHIQGLESLLRTNPYILAIGPLARSVAEASGRTAWLLDNRLDLYGKEGRRRVARLLLDQEENARQYKTLAYALNLPDRARAGDRYREARNAISKPGMFYPSEIVCDERSGDITLAREQLPGPSGFVRIAGEIFEDDANDVNAYYAYLSGMTHPSLYGLIETLAEVDEAPQSGEIPLREDAQFVKTITWNAMAAFHNSWRAWMGWTDLGLAEIQEVHQLQVALNGEDD